MRYEGNIFRPPGEWKSYLLQCTVGCSHNRCTFCGMYKDKRFHIRPLADILEDIDLAKARYGDVKRVFLCDGDAIVMKQDQLLTILEKLYASFPSLERVNTYAGPGPPCPRRRSSCGSCARRGWSGPIWGWRQAPTPCCRR